MFPAKQAIEAERKPVGGMTLIVGALGTLLLIGVVTSRKKKAQQVQAPKLLGPPTPVDAMTATQRAKNLYVQGLR